MSGGTTTWPRGQQPAATSTMLATLACVALTITTLGLASTGLLHAASTPAARAAETAPSPNGYAALPLSFEPNVGQASSSVGFLARGNGYTTLLMPTEVMTMPASGGSPVQMRLVGANPDTSLVGEHAQPGVVNYFVGNNPARWHTDIPTFADVIARNVYPGIDVVYHGSRGHLEYDFRLEPGVDPGVIHLQFEGASRVAVDAKDGDLVITTPSGVLLQRAPTIFQTIGEARQLVAGGFVVRNGRDVAFHLGAYNVKRPLVIDPTLAYSTLLGGSGGNPDLGYAVAVDGAGEAYVTGFTGSTDFPTTPGAIQSTSLGRGAFVTKFNATGTALVYSTYLGGSSFDGGAKGIAVDAAGDAYVVGNTSSPDFPVTSGAFQTTCGDCANGASFVTKLSATGSALVYSTFVGGSTSEFAEGIALDQAGDAYITGATASADFPTTPGAFQTACPNCAHGGSAFISKLNPSGSALSYSTFLGGAAATVGDLAFGIALDASNDAYVTGFTSSSDFPTTPGALATTCPSVGSACGSGFVTKLNPTGSGLVYSTFLGGATGGPYATFPASVAVDGLGQAYVVGGTQSTDFPVTRTAFERTAPPGTTDGFLTELDGSGSALLYSTYIGGNGQTIPRSVAVRSKGEVVVAGLVTSTTFEVKHPLQIIPAKSITNDAFIAEFDVRRNGSGSLLFATHLGGSGNEDCYGLVIDNVGNAFVTGTTQDPSNRFRPFYRFPTTPGAFQPKNAGSFDAFVAKISFSP